MDTLCTLVDVDTRDQKEPESGRTPRTVTAGSIVGLSGRGWTQALAHVVPDGVATHFLNQKKEPFRSHKRLVQEGDSLVPP